MLKERGIHHVDVGTSGGVWGLERGYCMMIGGAKEIVERLDPIFGALAPGLGDITRTPGRAGRDPRAEHGYIHAGPNGAGHFVKMIHNGIEYGLMQAYAEGFDILRNANSEALAGGRALRSRSHRHCRSVAPRQRHQFLAARSDGERARRRIRSSRASKAWSRIPAKAAGPSWRRSTKRCRRTCFRPRSIPVSARAATIPSRRKSSRRCGKALARTSNRKPCAKPDAKAKAS